MVVQELVAKLGFKIDAASEKKVDASLAKFEASAQRLISSFVRVARAANTMSVALGNSMERALDTTGMAAKYKEVQKIANDVNRTIKSIERGPRARVGGSLGGAGFKAPKGEDTGSIGDELMAFGMKAAKFAGLIWLGTQALQGLRAGISAVFTGAMDVEDLETQYKVMLGNGDAAKYMMQEIRDYANVTAYTTVGASKAVSILLSAMSGEQALSGMKLLGDIALGNQEKMQGLALAMMQVKQKGRIQGDELIQFAERGFDPLQYIAAKKKISVEDLRDQMEKKKLKLTYQDLVWAMEQATAKGGKFYKGAEEGGKTLRGRISTLRDEFMNLGIEMLSRVEPFLKDLINGFLTLFPLIQGSYRALADFMGIMFSGSDAMDWAIGLAASLSTVADALMVVGVLFQQFMLDWSLLRVVVQGTAGVILDVLEWVGKKISAIFRDMYGFIGGAGEILGISAMEKFGKNGEAEIQQKINAPGGDRRHKWTADAAQDVSDRAGKMDQLWDKIGSEGKGPGRVKPTSEIMEWMRKGQTKPMIDNRTTNNINNNVTVHGDDPLKMASESLFGQAFQKQFLAIQAATV